MSRTLPVRCGIFAALIAVALALAALIPAALSAQSPEPASVSGVLVNGTGGGATPSDIPVLLHVFAGAGGAVETRETLSDADGRFQFDDVPPLPSEGSAALVVSYGGAAYRRVLSPAELDAPLSLTVYDATQDIGVVTVAEQSIIIAGVDAATRRLAAVQLLTLENRSDTTLVPDLSAPPVIGQFSFMRFSLPPDAAELDVATDLVGGEVIPVGTGFALTAPAPPGRHQVSFTFTVPYAADTLAWRDNTLQGAESFRVVIPSELDGISVNGLPAAAPISLADVSYVVWQSEDIAPGAGVNLELTGLPEPGVFTWIGGGLSEPAFWFAAVPILVAVALAGLLVLGIWRRTGASSPDVTMES